MKSKVCISASIMCADCFNLERDILALKKAGIEYLHLDIMDGLFVNNITLGFDCCEQIMKYGIPRDIHLLVENPNWYVDRLKLKEGDIYQVHLESKADIKELSRKVHQSSAKLGVVLNPETPIECVKPYLEVIDVITLMMIKPGFAGRPTESGMIDKISLARDWLFENGHKDVPIEVDGHVNEENTPQMVKNGATILVAGTSSVFRKDNTIQEGTLRLRRAAELER